MIRNEGKYEDNHAHLETVGRNLLLEKGFNTDAQIKVMNPLKSKLYSTVIHVVFGFTVNTLCYPILVYCTWPKIYIDFYKKLNGRKA